MSDSSIIKGKSLQTLYEYYSHQQLLPTFARFQSTADLNAYEQKRRDIFVRKLGIPLAIFKNSKLLEFGPDSGENSLVFARWGALCTLCEPNLKAHPFIEDYFRKFNLSSQLVELNKYSIAGEKLLPNNYDIINAEGFIYTVKPNSLWMNLFSRLLDRNGFVIINYLDVYGSFFEILLKLIYMGVKRSTGMNSLDAASEVFNAKWNSISHTRSIDSWVMDVLENPFVRLRYFLEPKSLCQQMYDLGFSLYSSCPSYKDGLAVDWVKKPWAAAEALRSQKQFIARSVLSHFFGRECFLIQPDLTIEKLLWDLMTKTDNLLDKYEPQQLAQFGKPLDSLAKVIRSNQVMITQQETSRFLNSIECVQHVFQLLEHNDIKELISFCNKDQSFILNWGNPTHYAVFCRH